MKKRIQIHYFQKIILAGILILTLLFGGNSLFAASKKIYIVVVKKAAGAMTTTFHVYATSENEAKEEVALNGWEVVSTKLIKEADQVNNELAANIVKDSNKQKDIQSGSKSNNTKDMGIEKGFNIPKIANSSKKQINNNSSLKSNSKVISYESNKYLFRAYFDFAMETLSLDNSTKAIIQKFDKDHKYIIYGYTDSVPVKRDNSRYRNNHELSIKRARFIQNEMINLSGIPKENIRIVGMGQRFPAASDTEGGQPKNRRVEIYESLYEH